MLELEDSTSKNSNMFGTIELTEELSSSCRFLSSLFLVNVSLYANALHICDNDFSNRFLYYNYIFLYIFI